MGARPKVVSLTYELAQLGEVIDGARILVELIAREALEDEEQTRVAPGAVAATLGVIRNRLRLLESAIRGNTDPGQLWTPQNAAEEKQKPWDDGDMRMLAWSDGEHPRKTGASAWTRTTGKQRPRR